MVYNFIPDVIKNQITDIPENSITVASFYEFLLNTRPNFKLNNNVFNFYMPIKAEYYVYDCVDWSEAGCMSIDENELSRLSKRYCGASKFCPDSLQEEYYPALFTATIGDFIEVDSIGARQLHTVREATNLVAFNISKTVKRYWTATASLPSSTEKFIEVVMDKDILFKNTLESSILTQVGDLATITITEQHEIRPIYELARVFDKIYTRLIENNFNPMYSITILLNEQLTILPIVVTTNIGSINQQVNQLPALSRTYFDRYQVSWQPLTLDINVESGIMAILIKKLQEQGYTFEQFLEMQIENRKPKD